MTRFPYEAGVIEFTPDSLKNLVEPPKFLIRTSTPRDRQRVNRIIMEEGLRQHSVADMREEMLRGIKAGWSDELFAEYEGRIRGYWDAADQHQRDMEGVEDPVPFDHPDREAMDRLIDDVRANWKPLRVMIADIVDFNAGFPDVIVSVLMKGWRNLDVTYRREQDVVPLTTMMEVRDALAAIEDEHKDKVDGVGAPGTAYAELASKCTGMIFVTETEEKNSESPSLSSATPSTSNEAGKAQADGSSTAKNTTETPAT